MASLGRSKVPFILSVLLLSHLELSTFAARGQRRNKGNHEVRCKDGMFDDRRQGAENGTLSCRPCSQCLTGYGVSRLCTLYNDTECSPCPSRQYSATISSLDGCIACRTCGKFKVVENACTAKSDTVCVAHCPEGNFYSHVDENCLPCSTCEDQYGRTSERVEGPECADMAPAMQCWPLPTMTRGSPEDLKIPDPDTKDSSQPSDDHTSPTPYHYPRLDAGTSGHGMDDATARIYTVVLLTLFLVSSLCVVVCVIAIACLCRFMNITGKSFRGHGINNGGYENLSTKTSEFLVKNTTYV